METKQRLGEMLISAGLLKETQLQEALRLQVGGNRRLGYLLIKMGFIDEKELHTVLSEQLDLSVVQPDKEFSSEVKKILPKYLCKKYSAIPLALGAHNTLKIAMVDPSDSEAVSDIEQYTGKILQVVLAAKSDIHKSIGLLIPWSLKDLFNPQISTRITAIASIIALILIVITATNYYNDKIRAKQGKITRTASSTSYENHELILGVDKSGKVSLLGRGAHAAGYYSITFNDIQSLNTFLDRKKQDFSQKQLEWLAWAVLEQTKSQ
ncbi:MAG: hypothetical protein GQ559_08795 [Desulfobulbaceae bacterium]|nr:hypothetical protein [Desulfobulbaceae bacterium]